MKELKSNISVKVNKKDKEQAINILKDLGLNMSTAINMYIKEIIENDGIPFKIVNAKSNK